MINWESILPLIGTEKYKRRLRIKLREMYAEKEAV